MNAQAVQRRTGPGEPDVFGEHIPGEQGQDADVYADRDYPGLRAEPWGGEVAEGRKGAEATERAQQAGKHWDDGRGHLARGGGAAENAGRSGRGVIAWNATAC